MSESDGKNIEQGENPPYQSFKKSGGSLTESDYQTTIGMVKQMTKIASFEKLIGKAKKPVVSQFDNQAEICNKLGINTTLKQKAIYCFLRHRKESDPPLVMRACGLADQEIMADIILMTGTVSEYSKYLGHYPAIAKRRFSETV